MDTNPTAEHCHACGHPRSAHTDLRAGGRLGCYRHPCSCTDYQPPPKPDVSGPEMRWNPNEPGDPTTPTTLGRWETWPNGKLDGWSADLAAASAEIASRLLNGPPVQYPGATENEAN